MEKPRGWRKGQTIFNFLEWLAMVKKVPYNQNRRMADPFFLEDKEYDEYYKEFVKEQEEFFKVPKV